MIVTTSWDDGDGLDERVADLLDRHCLKGTFYIPYAHRPRRMSDQRIRQLAARHEIGAHGMSHRDLTTLSPADKRQEIDGSKKWLEDLLGQPIEMFCYPFGRFDGDTRTAVIESGFQGARSTKQFVLGPGDRFSLGTTLQVYPTPLRPGTMADFYQLLLSGPCQPAWWRAYWNLVNSSCRGWRRFAEVLFQSSLSLQHPGSVFHLWGHSWEIDQYGLWAELDLVLELLARSSKGETNAGVVASGPG